MIIDIDYVSIWIGTIDTPPKPETSPTSLTEAGRRERERARAWGRRMYATYGWEGYLCYEDEIVESEKSAA